MIESTATLASIVEENAEEGWLSKSILWAYVVVLAWAPYPLGSNRPWSWNLLILLISLCWILWGIAHWNRPQGNWTPLFSHPVPFGLALCTILWAVVQALPIVPSEWTHPAWNTASSALGQTMSATISLNPWHTLSECLKLCSYVLALWLAYLLARSTPTAFVLLDSVIAIGAIYGLYSVILELMGYSQFELLYSSRPAPSGYFAGPFVLHNSYATFTGLVALAAMARLVSKGHAVIVATRGLRQTAVSGLQYLLGRGVGYLVAFLICFSTLIATASRAGTLATLVGLISMLVLAAFVGNGRSARRLSVAATILLGSLVLGLIALNGNMLAFRFYGLVDAGGVDAARLALWSAATRMISDAPLLGLGLGTFPDAYPLYASQVLPFVMDKAHNDYLEFAAGLGLPAAIAWWVAWLLLVFDCARGISRRRRNRQFVILAVGASALVAVHSAFDFSLQIPAVAFLYATLMGIGLAQARSTQAAR